MSDYDPPPPPPGYNPPPAPAAPRTYIPPAPQQRSTASSVASSGNGPGMLFGSPLASWPRRTLATLIDFGVTIYLPSLLPKVGGVLALALVLFNSVYMQSKTSQSLGKRITGLYLVWPVVDPADPDGGALGAYPSAWRCLLRFAIHFFDFSFFLIGFLRPIWNPRRQTFADSLAKTAVFTEDFNLVHVPITTRSVL